MTAVVLRQAGLDDVRTMLNWANGEGWNPGVEDVEAFFAADPGGFFVADVGGSPVASVSVVNHSDAFSFLGLYICRSEFRGQGFGFALWKHALGHAGDRVVGLDGVAAQEANYAKSGFVRSGATLRLEGAIAPRAAADVRDARDTDGPEIARLDREANGFSRSRFVDAWRRPAESRRTVVLSDEVGLRGYATIRRCKDGVKIGPVVAQEPDAALVVMKAAVGRLPADRVIVDVPAGNAGFLQRLNEHGFRETFRTARMYRGRPPGPSDTLMAIATMELG